MKNMLLVVLLSCVMSSQGVFVKWYNQKVENTVENSSLITIARIGINTLFFLIMSGFSIRLHMPTMAYGCAYGVMLAVNLISNTMALMTGPFALTSLIVSASMVLVAVYGMTILGEPVTITMVLGILLLIVSLVLLNGKMPADCRLTLKWWFYVMLSFICNAGCTLSMKLHQLAFPGDYGNEFMVYGTILCVLICLVYCIAKKVSVSHVKSAFSKGWMPMVGVGIACSLVNYLMLKLNVIVPASIMYPTLTGLGLVIAALLSWLAYHEKFSNRQKLSYLIGACSVVLMNL